jgi:hypothetical protein
MVRDAVSIRENYLAKRSQRVGQVFDLIQSQVTDLTYAPANRGRDKIAPVNSLPATSRHDFKPCTEIWF